VQPEDIQGYGRAIVALIDDPERCQRMGTLGRQRFMNQLSWEDQQDKLLQAYTKALGEELIDSAFSKSQIN
jgi:glycosyltransferase involved in cell wall biosynthesis